MLALPPARREVLELERACPVRLRCVAAAERSARGQDGAAGPGPLQGERVGTPEPAVCVRQIRARHESAVFALLGEEERQEGHRRWGRPWGRGRPAGCCLLSHPEWTECAVRALASGHGCFRSSLSPSPDLLIQKLIDT